MRLVRALRRLRRDRRGVTIIEFAMIIPALCVVLMATFELGWRMYVASVVQGALNDAARMATVGGVTNAQIDALVRTRLKQVSNGGTITTSTDSYDSYDDVAIPETITSDTAPIGRYNVGDCYEDYNGNGQYDLDRGRTGMGNADDIVRYQLTITYPRMFPIAGFLGWGNTDSITASTALRNQPYAGRSTASPPVICT